MKSRIVVTLAVAAFATSGLAAAQPPHANNPDKGAGPPAKVERGDGVSGREHRQGNRDDVEDAVSLIVAGIAAAEARELARTHGIRGGKPLPPGIRKNLARGKPLPPGIAMQSIPPGMLSQLPHYDGYEWRRYGTDLVLVSLASAVIADVLVDVFD